MGAARRTRGSPESDLTILKDFGTLSQIICVCLLGLVSRLLFLQILNSRFSHAGLLKSGLRKKVLAKNQIEDCLYIWERFLLAVRKPWAFISDFCCPEDGLENWWFFLNEPGI